MKNDIKPYLMKCLKLGTLFIQVHSLTFIHRWEANLSALFKSWKTCCEHVHYTRRASGINMLSWKNLLIIIITTWHHLRHHKADPAYLLHIGLMLQLRILIIIFNTTLH
ncbi:hypothetical protein EJ110_NYTH17318 [Nymphaea thermarum]|nr:hypothetical protein EJ110_NYTH17318 [Nymphaea thermarum]